MSRAHASRPAIGRGHSQWSCCVPIVVVGLVLSACTDETGITPPNPLRTVGPGTNEFIITTPQDTEVCDAPPGECSLRGAILAVNDDPEGGPYTVVLQAGETYPLTIGALPIRAGVVIQGNGATIEQRAEDEDVLSVQDSLEQRSVRLRLEEATVTGANGRFAHGIRVSHAVLMLSHSVVTGNNSDYGAGIRAISSTVELDNSRISDNMAEQSGGGIYATPRTDLTLTNSVVSGNRSRFTAGIYIGIDGSLTLIRSTVSDNVGAGPLINSLVGDGIHVSTGSTASIVNATVSNNGSDRQDGVVGGGILVSHDAEVAVVNSTISGNNASGGVGGIRSYRGGVVTLSNTIVAGQEAGPDCGADEDGVITSVGHNLDSDGSCGLDAPGDVSNGDPGLGPLADNGGPTETHELLDGSDAIDAGDSAVCAAEPVYGVDQRGLARGTPCDIGAAEHDGAEPEELAIVTTDLPDGRVGEPYNATLEAEGGTPPYTWGTSAGGGVPDGLRLPVTGEISGTPTEAGTFEVGVVLFDSGEPGRSAERNLLLTIEPDTRDLTVVVAGSGEGRVTSEPAGIDCTDECTAAFEKEVQVTLTALASENSEFSGWTGEACNGDAEVITVMMSEARTCAAAFDIVPVPTALTAEPALLQLDGGLLGLRLRLLDLTARLVRTDTGAPIQGETVTMTVDRLSGEDQEVCSAVTDADGVATCGGGLPSLLGLVLSGYNATFAGSLEYEPSSASAPLIRVELN